MGHGHVNLVIRRKEEPTKKGCTGQLWTSKGKAELSQALPAAVPEASQD
jgi:hypothetical protein